jgi:Na+(H+)/acetate symporter ActP
MISRWRVTSSLRAPSFLGLSGLIFATGFDDLVYAVGYTLGYYPIIIFFLADQLRRLGKYTFSDVVAFIYLDKRIESTASSPQSRCCRA